MNGARPPPAAFVLAALDELPALSREVEDLAARAVNANPFFEPAFLLPAAEALNPGGVQLATVRRDGRLILFAPMVRARFPRRMSVWTHPYAPLGVPLVDASASEAAFATLLAGSAMMGCGPILFSDLPFASAAAETLRAAGAECGMRVFEAAPFSRPVLRLGDRKIRPSLGMLAAPKHRKELRRQLRRLQDRQAVSFETARGEAEVATAFEAFVQIEASGWKGRRGTALAQHPAELAFARSAILGLARAGKAEIDLMRVGRTPAAAMIRITSGGLAIPWKTAFDEAHAQSSPGKQLMWRATANWLADGDLVEVDPVCEEGNPMLSMLWRDSEPYGTLVVGGAGASAIVAGLLDAKSRIRKRLRRAISRR
ncbi:GNAT family N-acetyltransferase [Faunimonas sp. B44]|uniref:GNAT family N-acetyltransferase n=1 Tax=Faunimonas sp. B44 TaxID=3461493 RepID=UPI00404502F4